MHRQRVGLNCEFDRDALNSMMLLMLFRVVDALALVNLIAMSAGAAQSSRMQGGHVGLCSRVEDPRGIVSATCRNEL